MPYGVNSTMTLNQNAYNKWLECNNEVSPKKKLPVAIQTKKETINPIENNLSHQMQSLTFPQEQSNYNKNLIIFKKISR